MTTTDTALAWAITHEPTRQAYARCTGEDVGPALDRYVSWLRENVIGPDVINESRGEGPAPRADRPGTGVPLSRRIS